MADRFLGSVEAEAALREAIVTEDIEHLFSCIARAREFESCSDLLADAEPLWERLRNEQILKEACHRVVEAVLYRVLSSPDAYVRGIITPPEGFSMDLEGEASSDFLHAPVDQCTSLFSLTALPEMSNKGKPEDSPGPQPEDDEKLQLQLSNLKGDHESLHLQLSTLKAENEALKQRLALSKWSLARNGAQLKAENDTMKQRLAVSHWNFARKGALLPASSTASTATSERERLRSSQPKGKDDDDIAAVAAASLETGVASEVDSVPHAEQASGEAPADLQVEQSAPGMEHLEVDACGADSCRTVKLPTTEEEEVALAAQFDTESVPDHEMLTAAMHEEALQYEKHRVALRSHARDNLVQEWVQGSLMSALKPILIRKPSFEPVRQQTCDMIRMAFSNGTLVEALQQVSGRAEAAGSLETR